jgi:hypothetical protein
VEEAARKRAEAVWLAPGLDAREARARAEQLGMPLIAGRDIHEALDAIRGDAGRPRKLGVHLSRRKREYEDNRPRRPAGGYIEGGGGGKRGGGGGHAVLDERKMVAGKPSPRRGPKRRRGLE